MDCDDGSASAALGRSGQRCRINAVLTEAGRRSESTDTWSGATEGILASVEPRLAEALGDTPETVIPCHQLVRGLARCWVAGTLPDFEAALVQATNAPREPTGFGRSAHALWRLLRDVAGWTCVSVDARLAEPLRRLVEADLGVPARLYGDIHHVLWQSAAVHEHPWVRRLTVEDLPVILAAPPEVQGSNWGSARAMVEDGFVAGALADGELVAIATVGALTAAHADVGVATLEPYRGRGLSTAAASLVARWAQSRGRTPVWSTGEDNAASLRVARKLGFVEVSRREFVIPAAGA
jgi:RimJ/RimL family protein N-acetyltransferase